MVGSLGAEELPLNWWRRSTLEWSLLGVLDLGVGTRGTRIAAAAVHTRARTATGWGTLYLKFVVLGSSLPG